ncbi:MAG: cyclopropane-fatty-acyl-phospholipid synthase family protein [Sphingomonas sp.]
MAAGSLELLLPDGGRRVLGGRAAGPAAALDLKSWRALLRLALGGSSGLVRGLGEGRMGEPRSRCSSSRWSAATAPRWAGRCARRGSPGWRCGSRNGCTATTAADRGATSPSTTNLGNDFYEAWLDPGMGYSSARFARPGQSLEEAQAEKVAAILDRTGTGPGDSILEIGCGWGSFLEAAARGGRRVHGITLSTEQKAYAEARMARHGLGGVSISLTDYRDVTGRYDAWRASRWSRRWAANIGRTISPRSRARSSRAGARRSSTISFDDAYFEEYAANVDFIQTHIFPGGLLISERQFRAAAEAHGLAWRDRDAFGLGYAETLRQWRENFDAAAAAGRLPRNFDSRFIDLWRYYLMYCEGGFRGGGIDVAQVTLVKEQS